MQEIYKILKCHKCSEDTIMYSRAPWPQDLIMVPTSRGNLKSWHKKCYEEDIKAKNKKKEERRKAEKESKIQRKKREEARKAKKKEKEKLEAKLLSQRAKNLFETGFSETDAMRSERERKAKEKKAAARKAEEERLGILQAQLEDQIKREKIREQNMPVSIHDISKVNLPCTLCGTSSCKNKNSCMVTSD